MIEILQSINKIPDVEGCLVAENNGIVVMGDLESSINEENLAAASSSKMNEIKKSLSEFAAGGIERCTISGTGGSYMFLNIGNAYLIILIRKDANLGYIKIEAEKHLKDLKKKLKL